MAASASASSGSLVFLLFMARILGFTVAVLVLFWATSFTSSFLPSSLSHQHHLLYSILHPLLMVIGFILISGEAILVHRWFPGSRGFKKCVHLWLQGVAMTCGFFGIWTKFQGKEGIVANFYSLHSWMGLLCISLFAAQWFIGFWNFWHRGEVRKVRKRVLPWHVFVGLYTYGLAVATAETGLAEKLLFIQQQQQQAAAATKHNSAESMVVNSLGLGLALLSVFVVFAALSSPNNNKMNQQHQHQFLQTKLSFSHSTAKALLLLVLFL